MFLFNYFSRKYIEKDALSLKKTTLFDKTKLIKSKQNLKRNKNN